jgi:S1-C subfamily serine protease
MRKARGACAILRLRFLACLSIAAAALCWASAADRAAAAEGLEDLVSAVVQIKTHINPEGQTVRGLGREREGSGVVIDEGGLVVTIGYLMVEAYAAEIITNDGRTIPASVVGYDNDTGFGLLRADEPLKIKPLPLGKSADVKDGDVVVVSSFGGPNMVSPAKVVGKRAFAGNWEYMLDEAIFTAPPHPAWSGAALISHEGKLIGIGSLIVGDAGGNGQNTHGNMFVPIDRLPPILGDLIAAGRVSGPARPWLGINADVLHGHLFITRVTPGGPAERAGLHRGDVIITVAGEPARTLSEFYRRIWSQGAAGATIRLDVLQDDAVRHFDVHSIDRLSNLKLKSTF